MRISWLVPALLLAAGATAPPAPAATAGATRGDFNGDGYVDLAIGAPEETVAGHRAAGAVTVLYGSATGLRTTGAQQWHQDVPGVAGTAEAGDRFGSAVASGDFDRDGYADLAVAAPTEDIPNGDHWPRYDGVVHVLYGSARGLSADGDELWQRGFEGSSPAAYVGYGTALAVGDFDDDTRDDLAVGSPGSALAGYVDILRGGADGLSPWQQYHPPNAYDEEYAAVGTALAAGDFDGSGVEDLAVGAPARRTTDGSGTARDVANAGEVVVLFGAAGTGLATTGAVEIDQDTPGVADDAEPEDRFGAGLAAGDLDGDGKADLVVGVPGEAVGSSPTRIGAVHVLLGSPTGPRAEGSTFWHRDGGGLAGGTTGNTGLGEVLAVGDLDGDGFDELAIGASRDDLGSVVNSGSVTVVYGAANGLSTSRQRFWHQNVSGVPGVVESGDYFGYAVAVRDHNRDGRGELVIGVPRESFDGINVTGLVTVLRGGTATAPQVWHQDVPGVPGAAEWADWFGGAVG